MEQSDMIGVYSCRDYEMNIKIALINIIAIIDITDSINDVHHMY